MKLGNNKKKKENKIRQRRVRKKRKTKISRFYEKGTKSAIRINA